MADIVIDLSSPFEEELLEPSPKRSRWRELSASLLVLLILASAASSGQPAKPPLIRLAMIDDRGGQGVVAIIDDLLLRYDRQTMVSAHELDGRQRWHADYGLGGHYSAVKLGQWLLLTSWSEMDPEAIVSIAVDPLTGQEIWRLPGRLEADDELVLVIGQRGKPAEVRRTATRELVWEIPPQHAVALDPVRHLVYTLDEVGHLTEYELATGRLLRSLSLPPQPRDWDAVFVADEVLEVISDGGFDNAMQVDRKTFQLVLQPVGHPVFERVCGPVICTYDREFGLSIVDNVTREELWRPLGEEPYPTAFGLLLTDGERNSWLADYFTGKRVGLPGWVPIRDGTGYPGELQLMRKLSPAGNRTELGVLVPGGVMTVAVLPMLLLDCRLEGDLLISQLLDQKIGVWRIELPSERDDH